jgi:hypothetical protein
MLTEMKCDRCEERIPLRGATILSGGYVACPKCGKENHVPLESKALTRDDLLREVSRSLRETHPEEAERLIRECEKRLLSDRALSMIGPTLEATIRTIDEWGGTENDMVPGTLSVEVSGTVNWHPLNPPRLR